MPVQPRTRGAGRVLFRIIASRAGERPRIARRAARECRGILVSPASLAAANHLPSSPGVLFTRSLRISAALSSAGERRSRKVTAPSASSASAAQKQVKAHRRARRRNQQRRLASRSPRRRRYCRRSRRGKRSRPLGGGAGFSRLKSLPRSNRKLVTMTTCDNIVTRVVRSARYGVAHLAFYSLCHSLCVLPGRRAPRRRNGDWMRRLALCIAVIASVAMSRGVALGLIGPPGGCDPLDCAIGCAQQCRGGTCMAVVVGEPVCGCSGSVPDGFSCDNGAGQCEGGTCVVPTQTPTATGTATGTATPTGTITETPTETATADTDRHADGPRRPTRPPTRPPRPPTRTPHAHADPHADRDGHRYADGDADRPPPTQTPTETPTQTPTGTPTGHADGDTDRHADVDAQRDADGHAPAGRRVVRRCGRVRFGELRAGRVLRPRLRRAARALQRGRSGGDVRRPRRTGPRRLRPRAGCRPAAHAARRGPGPWPPDKRPLNVRKPVFALQKKMSSELPNAYFLRKRESRARAYHHPTWIPAFAGMTGSNERGSPTW